MNRVDESNPAEGFVVRANDPDELSEGVLPLGGEIQFSSLERDRFRAEIRAHRFERVALFKADLCPLLVAQDGGRGFYGFTVPLRDSFDIHGPGRVSSFENGSAHLLKPSEDFDLRLPRGGTVLVANVNLEAFEPFDGSGRLAGELSLQTRAGSALFRYLNYVWAELEHGGVAMSSPIVRREVEDILVRLLRRSAEADHSRKVQRGPIARYYLTRAEDFLLANLTSSVTSDALATAAGISYRTLARAFRRVHGTTPMTFLKMRRLEAARRELMGSSSPDATVTEIALRYGFSNLGRFASEYRQAFGEQPSATLKC